MTTAYSNSKCILEPMDLHDPAQADELLRQRVLCGWAMTPDYIDAWRAAMDAKTKGFFWIRLPGGAAAAARAGHISLDSEADPPDLDLANPHDRSVLTIARFFLLPEHRGGGVGRAVMELLERHARELPYGSPNCRAIALDTLSRWYSEEEEGRAEYEWLTGQPPPARGRNNEDWYVRQGYVKFKEKPKYEGGDVREGHKLVAVYMRKTIA